jgi:hypothetical protein
MAGWATYTSLMTPLIGALLLLQQGAYLGNTSPSSGDTVGYWQQRVGYTIVATLDEERMAIRAGGELVYVNNSPDTLREMFFHQYLNAFRPGSKWSESDARENRVRFQNLQEPNYGYERFTAAPIVDGAPVVVSYPGSPDSTVARFELPRPLPPGGTIRVQLAWEARPSTVFRRQGRRGRTYDFAQWYPKVAVYDRGGWQPNPLIPAGEMYGEFGTYDVTLVVRDDQILGATGMPVVGDPGWGRVSRTGAPYINATAYGSVPVSPQVDVPRGNRAVRFYARDVHHFAWTASTEYVYEGGSYARDSSTPRRFQTWDTVGVHVLMKPGDDSTWGGGIALRRTIDALRWLESIYGTYAYPQITNVHRLDRGATEFPMMIMNSTASYGLILHELGHVYTYGILANNEWRSAWLDEGFTDYQTYWAQGLTPQEQIAGRGTRPPRLLPRGYRVNAVAMAVEDSTNIDQINRELTGRAEPIGRHAAEFSEFAIYNEMVYDRAGAMYAHLRDLMGDSVYVRFLREYYDRWALKHVDERALRLAASRAYGQDLAWFFDQWVHETGLLDYSLNGVSSVRDASGRWVSNVEIERLGDYVHPMPVGVHTSRGWSIARAHSHLDRQILQITTGEEPDSIVIDPFHVTWDWDRRNDEAKRNYLILARPRVLFDWPFVDQSDRSHTIVALSPLVWPSRPQNLALGVRARTSYLSSVDRYDVGIAYTEKNPLPVPGGSVGVLNRVQAWLRVENPYLPMFSRPLMGYRAGVALLDGITKVDLAKTWDLSPFVVATGPRLRATASLTGAYPHQSPLLPEQWTNTQVTEGTMSLSFSASPRADNTIVTAKLDLAGGYANRRHVPGARGYFRGLGALTSVTPIVPGRRTVTMRFVAGWSPRAPLQRSIFAASDDPFATFNDNYFRPQGAFFKRPNVNYRPMGGAGFRGYSPTLAFDQVIGLNAEGAERLHEWRGEAGTMGAWLTVFSDVAAVRIAPESPLGSDERFLAAGGVGLALRGRVYDRDVKMRLDFPIGLTDPGLSTTRASNGGTFAFRWAFSLNDLW